MRAPEVLTWLRRNGTRRVRDGMARYGIVAARACGVTMGELQGLRKRIGTDHALALAVARRLAQATAAAPRRVGKDAARELASPKVVARLARRPAATGSGRTR